MGMSRARAVAAGAVLLGVVAATLVACGPEAPPEEPEPALTALVHVRAGTAEVTDATGESVADPEGAVVSDGAVVEASGDDALIELVWSDGAVTRLGDGTRFAVGGADAADETRGTQSGGVSWNREADDGADDDGDSGDKSDTYAVRSSDAVVTDRGPYFVIDCRSGACRVTGTGVGGDDGSKTTIRRGELTADGGAHPASWGELFGDPWAVRNGELDEEAGFPPVTDVFAGADPGRASLDGTYAVVVTTVASTCDGGDLGCRQIPVVGRVRELEYTFGEDCSHGIPCAATVTTQFTDLGTGETQSREVPLRFDGESYLWGWVSHYPSCIWTYGDGTQGETGTNDNGLSWSATPTAGSVQDGAFVVTAMSGRAAAYTKTTSAVDSAAFPGCERWQSDWQTGHTIELTRTD